MIETQTFLGIQSYEKLIINIQHCHPPKALALTNTKKVVDEERHALSSLLDEEGEASPPWLTP